MNASEVQVKGISVDEIVDNKEELEDKARRETEEDVVIDPTWINAEQIQSTENVRAVLLKKQDNPGCVRVAASQKPSKFTLTESLENTVLVAAKPGEKIILLGDISVRCFRRRP